MRRCVSSVWLGLSCATLGSTAQEDCEVFPMLSSAPLGGAAHDGEALWVAEFFAKKIHRIDPDTGEVLATIPSPTSYALGLAWDGEALWVAGEQTATIYRVDPVSGAVLHSFHAPTYGQPDPNGADLAWDGAALWHADYSARKLRRLDPVDGSVLAELDSPGPQPIGLAMMGELLVVSDTGSDDVTVVDPADGSVVSTCLAPDAQSRGVAVDAQGRAFVSGWSVLGVHSLQLPRQDEPWFEAVCAGTTSSLGEVAGIVPEGGPSVEAKDLSLSVAPVPDDFVFLASSEDRGGRPFRDESLCIGRPVRVVGVGRAAAGEITFDVFRRRRLVHDLDPGETWTFQAVYRDRAARGLARWGLSDAIAITLEP